MARVFDDVNRVRIEARCSASERGVAHRSEVFRLVLLSLFLIERECDEEPDRVASRESSMPYQEGLLGTLGELESSVALSRSLRVVIDPAKENIGNAHLKLLRGHTTMV